MITIIDFGLGNIKAFAAVYKQLNMPFKVASSAEELSGASKLILPGIGAFDYAMSQFQASGMRETVEELVLIRKMPIMGICVGMQMLGKSSDEGGLPGLGWLDASVKRFDEKSIGYATRLPHMGWNDVLSLKENKLLKGLEVDARFYFLHSYYFSPNAQEDIFAVANYGIQFSCAVNRDNIYGVQFHPEKSHSFGVRLLKNFAEL